MFRKLQKKVQKRIVQASKLDADVGMLQFVRIAVQKNPSYRMHNKQALYTVAMTGLDYALTSVGADAIFQLTVELYCRVTDFADESKRLLKTISAIAREQRPPFQAQEQLLPLQALNKIGASVDASYVVGFLWRVYAAGFEYVGLGDRRFAKHRLTMHA
ncbi:hypothetical protein AAVH_01627 [Aphelenchoides avenae]|nr:hypothetical protein AAVH_01627 [Aphelenchus avenae]